MVTPMAQRVELLVIDPQNDFVDPKTAALYVPGAEGDMRRLAVMIDRIRGKLGDIHVTLDSHHPAHIAHPMFWKDSHGTHPAPFTTITADDVERGVWTTTQPGMYRKGLAYVRSLRDNGRYELTIWPPHCLIGSEGHAVYPPLFRALCEWERERFGVVDFVTKGSNVFTEHYSAVLADVPDPSDASTQINTDVIRTLEKADVVAIAGEALTHCVANTVRDIANNFGDDSFVSKLVLLTDASSGIPGFEGAGDAFMREMTARGMQTSTTVEFLA
jgi:nicotinamidase/pyrazinamidase